MVGENRANLIAYEAYRALEDKSGKYVVYNYSYCETYNNSLHFEDNNPCVITNEGCKHVIKECTAPLFMFKDYSTDARKFAQATISMLRQLRIFLHY